MAVVEHPPVALSPVEVDERAARCSLRDQIAKLERELAAAFVGAFPRHGIDFGFGTSRAPAARACSRWASSSGCATTSPSGWSGVRRQLHERAEAEEAKRELLERMLLEPGRYKWVRVTAARARPRRLRRLPRPPPPGHRWHAHGVVARENLLRLSVIHLTSR